MVLRRLLTLVAPRREFMCEGWLKSVAGCAEREHDALVLGLSEEEATMLLIIAQDVATGAGMIPLPLKDVENLIDGLGWFELHASAVGTTEALARQGYAGPYVLLLCDTAGEIYGRAPAGRPAMYLWETWDEPTSDADGYLTGKQQWLAFGELVKQWLANPKICGAVALG